MRLCIVARHGRSILNDEGVVNGDPALDRGLAALGRREASRLGVQIAATAFDACIVSQFPRAQETARLALGTRIDLIPWIVDSDLDDIRVGRLEGRTLEDYRVWKHAHRRNEPFPGGESLDDAARRYAQAFERIITRVEENILCVCHEIPVRYAVNAAGGSSDLDQPAHDIANAEPYVFDRDGLGRAVARMRELSR